MSRTKSIGVFDSGLGGLTVLRAVMSRLPQYRYVYLGDTARAPYGDRTSEEILRFAKEAVDFLFSSECELILFACNTASAEALRSIQQGYLREKYGTQKRVLGVIVPTLEYISANPAHKKVGVLATRATVASGTYPLELAKIAPEIEIFQNPAPALVEIVENGEQESERALALSKEYLSPLLDAGVDTVILGCTHYEHLLPQLTRAAGNNVKLVCQSTIVADKVSDYLERHPEIEATLAKSGEVTFYTTDTTGRFERESARFFGREVEAEHVQL